jgi:phage anti-repressor protein
MENELIALRDAVMKDGETVPAVNARELHGFLGVRTRFNDWIARRIEDGGFVEGEDYSFLSTAGADCLVSLNMAKHLAMLERNDKGKQARQYFIECEKRLHAAPVRPMSMEEILFHQSKILLDTRARLDTQEAILEKHDQIAARHEHTLLEVGARLDILDSLDIDGTPRRMLNALVRKYAWKHGLGYDAAWKEFIRRFNLA